MAIAAKIKDSLERASWIRRMFEEGEEMKKQYGAENVFDFSLGNPDLEPPPALQKTLQDLVNHPVPGMHRYMPNSGYAETRNAIARFVAEETGLPFEAKHIIMTTGAAAGMNVALKALLDPGDEMIVPAPYFVEYPFYADNAGGTIRFFDTREDFSLDLDALEKVIGARTKVVLINSPNNPTGAVYDGASLERLGTLLKRKSRELGKTIYLLLDEPYRRIVFDGIPLPDTFGIYPHTIRVISHSKDLALAGERIGYNAVSPLCDGADELMGAMIFTNRTLGFVNAPALMQRLVGSCQKEVVNVRSYEERRDLFYNALKGFGYDVVKPQGAFYLFPRTPIPDDVAFVKELLARRILAVPGRGFGRAGYIRIAYSVDRRVIEGALPGFKDAIARYR